MLGHGLATLTVAMAALLPGLAENLVVPDTEVPVTLEGPPGAFFALAASSAGSGLVVRDQPLALGPDARLLATGRRDAAGRATVTLAPDFAAGPVLYLQAVTAPTPAFDTVTPSPGKVLRDLTALLRALQVDLPGARTISGSGSTGRSGPLLADALAGRDGLIACVGWVTTPALADAAVTVPKLAPGAVGAAQIDPLQVQARVAGTCPPGQYLRAVNSDGSAVCAPLVARHASTTVDDPADAAGTYTSIDIGADGLPIISHHSPGGRRQPPGHPLRDRCLPVGPERPPAWSSSGPTRRSGGTASRG